MKGNRTEQQNRGEWQKDRADRGVFQRGKVWYVRFTDAQHHGHVERVGPSKALALKVYQKRKTEVAERQFFPSASVTVGALVDEAIAEARRNGKYTLYRYHQLRGWFGDRRAAALTPLEIEKRLAAHCQTPANFNRLRDTLSHAYRIAVENGLLADNVARRVKRQRENNTRVRFLEPEEETALREAIREMDPGREAEFDLALYTGMRWAEQYGLRWAQVDLKRSQLTLPTTKSGVQQYVRLNRPAVLALQKLRGRDPEFVCSRQTYQQVMAWFKHALKQAKIHDFNWHDLRHTFASRLVMSGVDVFTVSKLLRHGSVTTTQRYAHLTAAHLQAAVEQLAGSDTASVTIPAKPTARAAQIVN